MSGPSGEPASAEFAVTAQCRRVLIALLGRLIPSDDGTPGAVEAGVPAFVENELAGPVREAREAFLHGCELLDEFAEQRHGAGFADLDVSLQDEVLSCLDGSPIDSVLADPVLADPVLADPVLADPVLDEAALAGAVSPELRGFFDLALNLCIDGFLSDPRHGGNADAVGWRLIGYPGINLNPTAAEQQIDHVVPFHGTTIASLTAPDMPLDPSRRRATQNRATPS